MQLKRKGPEKAVVETDLNNAQAPSKKMKTSWGHSLPTIFEHGPVPIVEEGPSPTIFDEAMPEVCPVEVPSDASPGNSPPAVLYVTEPDSDERAMVLYKPMSKPAELRTFPSNYRDFQVSDAVDWFSPSKSFRHLGNGSTNNSLAVIPYVEPYKVLADCGGPMSGKDSLGGRVIIEDITDQEQEKEEEDNVDAMAIEDTAAPMDADVVEEMDTMDVTPAPLQFPQQQLQAPQWQHFGSQYTPVFW